VSSWTIFTNHAQVLILLLEDPVLRIRDLAERLSITERGTQRIIAELIEEGSGPPNGGGPPNTAGALPFTGFDPGITALVGLLMLLLGVTLRSTARRRYS